MNYLVVQSHQRDVTKLWVERDGDRQIKPPFESWAIQSGKQVLFVNQTLGRKIDKLRISGNFMQTTALYGLEYEELVAVIRQHMGPSDRELYESTKGQKADYSQHTIIAVSVGLGLLMLIIAIIVGSIQFALAMAIVPLIISFFGRKNR